MGRKKYLLKNTLVFALGNLGSKFISFFLVPLYTYTLTTSEYGIIDLFSTIVTLTIPIVSLNIAEAILRFGLDEEIEKSKIVSISIICSVISTIMMVCLLPITGLWSELDGYHSLLLAYCISSMLSQIFTCYLRGTEKLLEYSIASIIQAVSIGSLNYIFLVILKLGIRGYLWSFIISHFVVFIYAIFAGRLFTLIKSFSIDKKLFFEMVKYSMALVPNSLMWWITNSSDRVMITYALGSAANGIYSISYKIPSMLSVFSNIFNTAWSYSAYKENNSSDKDDYTNIVYNNMISFLFFIAASILLVLKPFMKIYVGAEFAEAWRYSPYLIVGFMFMALGSFVATPYIVNKDSFHMMLSGVSGAIVNIILNVLLIPRIGINGAAFATCFSYMVIYLFRLFDTQKYVKLKTFSVHNILSFAFLIFMVVIEYEEGVIAQIILLFIWGIILFLQRKCVVDTLLKIKNKRKK